MQSTSFRVAAATVQKTLESNYVLKVNEELLLSLGEHKEKELVKHDLKRTRDCERKSSTTFKKRKSSLKSRTQSALECKDMREGTTYASGLNLGNSSTADNIHEIPPPSYCPPYQLLQMKIIRSSALIWGLQVLVCVLTNVGKYNDIYFSYYYNM